MWGNKIITGVKEKGRSSKEVGTYLWKDLDMEHRLSGKNECNYKGSHQVQETSIQQRQVEAERSSAVRDKCSR